MYSKNKIVEKRVKKNADMPLELFEAFAILLKLTVCTFFSYELIWRLKQCLKKSHSKLYGRFEILEMDSIKSNLIAQLDSCT